MKKQYPVLVTGFLLVAFLFFSPIRFAEAAATVTAATGGSSVSADTTGGAYTSLTGPVISEGATGDIGGNGNLPGTIILNVPSGFIFDTGGTAPTVLVTRTAGNGSNNNNINSAASGSSLTITSITTTKITFTVTGSTQGSVKNSLTWQNVRALPSAGTPLASGNITENGTVSITGVTGSTNFGTLTEVVGAKSQLVITTQPSSSATTATDFETKPVIAVEDQFGSTITSDSATTITRTAVLSTQSCGGTAGSGTLTSTPASGAAVSSGIMTYAAMQYSSAESIKVCFSSSGVTSALSNAITMASGSTPPPPSPPPPSPSPSPTPTPSPTPSSTSGGVAPTSVGISGQAYPGSRIEFLRKSIQDEVFRNTPEATSTVSADGAFRIRVIGLLGGEYFFALRAEDKDGRKTGIIGLNADLSGIGSSLEAKDILMPPTVDFEKAVIALGGEVKVRGYAAPADKIEMEIDGILKGETKSDKNGYWTFSTSTAPLRIGNHYARARQTDTGGKASEFSVSRTFRVSLLLAPKADFNNDDKVNIADLSVFLFRWSSGDRDLRAKIDMNNDGKIDISDFSIFLKAMQL